MSVNLLSEVPEKNPEEVLSFNSSGLLCYSFVVDVIMSSRLFEDLQYTIQIIVREILDYKASLSFNLILNL